MQPKSFHPEEFQLKGNGDDIKDLPVLPAHYGSTYGLISCWTPSLLERIKLILGQPLYLVVLGNHHPPVYLTTEPQEVGLQNHLRKKQTKPA